MESVTKELLHELTIEQKHDFLIYLVKNNKRHDLIQELLNLNTDTKSDPPLLHLAAENGDTDLLKMFLTDINILDSEGNNALHIAAENGNKECVSILMRNKINSKHENCEIYTPYDLALISKNLSVAKYIALNQ